MKEIIDKDKIKATLHTGEVIIPKKIVTEIKKGNTSAAISFLKKARPINKKDDGGSFKLGSTSDNNQESASASAPVDQTPAEAPVTEPVIKTKNYTGSKPGFDIGDLNIFQRPKVAVTVDDKYIPDVSQEDAELIRKRQAEEKKQAADKQLRERYNLNTQNTYSGSIGGATEKDDAARIKELGLTKKGSSYIDPDGNSLSYDDLVDRGVIRHMGSAGEEQRQQARVRLRAEILEREKNGEPPMTPQEEEAFKRAVTTSAMVANMPTSQAGAAVAEAMGHKDTIQSRNAEQVLDGLLKQLKNSGASEAELRAAADTYRSVSKDIPNDIEIREIRKEKNISAPDITTPSLPSIKSDDYIKKEGTTTTKKESSSDIDEDKDRRTDKTKGHQRDADLERRSLMQDIFNSRKKRTNIVTNQQGGFLQGGAGGTQVKTINSEYDNADFQSSKDRAADRQLEQQKRQYKEITRPQGEDQASLQLENAKRQYQELDRKKNIDQLRIALEGDKDRFEELTKPQMINQANNQIRLMYAQADAQTKITLDKIRTAFDIIKNKSIPIAERMGLFSVLGGSYPTVMSQLGFQLGQSLTG